MKAGQPQRADTRLFMQLLVFGGCSDSTSLIDALEQCWTWRACCMKTSTTHAVSALLTFSDDPAHVSGPRAPASETGSVRDARPETGIHDARPHASLGYEPDLIDVLLHRPGRTVLNREWPWSIWYPLRRSGRFAQLPIRGTTGHSGRARGHRHVIRRCGSCARYPPRVPRPGQGRQRFRDWTHWKGSVSALSDRCKRCERRSRLRCTSSGSGRFSWEGAIWQSALTG